MSLPKFHDGTSKSSPGTPAVLGTQMQAVGEVMAIGRTFPESLQKAIRSLETGRAGLNADHKESLTDNLTAKELLELVETPTPERIYSVESLLRKNVDIAEISKACGFDPWFLHQMKRISDVRNSLTTLETLSKHELKNLKQLGFSNPQISYILKTDVGSVQVALKKHGLRPTYKTVDTCAAEFAADTPYYYSTWEDENEASQSNRNKVLILGSGPNRIGQGIEFDYTCVHASFAAHESGHESIMYNCNPETVSTDYDTSDKLYFEPITLEDVQNVIELEKPDGIIVSLGGQTPLKLANDLPQELILGTPPDSIDLAEDRDRWNELCEQIGVPQPPGATAMTLTQAGQAAERIGFPLLVRPSYVLGGQSMKIVHNNADLISAFKDIIGTDEHLEHPLLLDRFLEDSIELDVDSVRDASGELMIGGIMEHVERAGIHSGDSACSVPAQNISNAVRAKLVQYTQKIADALHVVGLINIQFAVQGEDVFVIEANPARESNSSIYCQSHRAATG